MSKGLIAVAACLKYLKLFIHNFRVNQTRRLHNFFVGYSNHNGYLVRIAEE